MPALAKFVNTSHTRAVKDCKTFSQIHCHEDCSFSWKTIVRYHYLAIKMVETVIEPALKCGFLPQSFQHQLPLWSGAPLGQLTTKDYSLELAGS